MSDSKPVRLTVASYGEGTADIFTGGKRVGIAIDEGRGTWRAYLYPVATDRRVRPADCEEVTAGKLGELRGMLRERVELKGPWWTA